MIVTAGVTETGSESWNTNMIVVSPGTEIC